MKYLLDTNLLLRVAIPTEELHPTAVSTILALQDRDDLLATTPQVLYEYWVVLTRPLAQNGLGLTPAEADHTIQDWLNTLICLPDHADVFFIWRQLVTQHQVLGKKAHDARLAATAIYYECDGIVTFNAADFQRFTPLQILTPEQVLQA